MAGGGGYGEQFTSLVARDGRGAGADAEAGRRWAACSSMARQIKHARGLSWARVVGRAAASALCGQLLALSARRPNAIAPTPMTTLGRAGLAGAVMLARSSASARCSRRAGQGRAGQGRAGEGEGERMAARRDDGAQRLDAPWLDLWWSWWSWSWL